MQASAIVAEETCDQGPQTSHLRSAKSAARILYAEDDPFMRDVTVRVLERAGYSVTSVEDGSSAWEALQTQPFDLFITDNDMPHITGLELVARLRRQKKSLPIILASGSAGFYSSEEYQWLRFSVCLQKPFPPSQLIDAVDHSLQH